MPTTNSILGSEILGQNLGPCHIYWDIESGGQNLFLGKTDATTVRKTVEKTDLVTSQDGAGAADRVITTETWEIEFGMAQATMERFKAMDESMDFKMSGPNITGAHFSSVIGNGDFENAKRIKVVRIVNGEDSTNPLDAFVFYKCRITPSAEWVFDAATQRFVSVMGTMYKDPTKLDSQGRPTYGYVGTV